MRRYRNDLHERLFLVAERSMAQDVLHHHYRPIHHHAEVERAQRQQVRRNLPQVQQDCREQQREGNGDGHNQRAAHISQEQKQNQCDQQHSVGQVTQHRVRRVLHELAAVQMRNKLHAHRQQTAASIRSIQLVNLLVQIGERCLCHRALAQQHNPFHHIAVIDDRPIFLVNGFSQLSKADFRCLDHSAQVAHPHRRSVLHLHHGRGNVVRALHQSHGAHVQCLFAAFDKSAARVDVVRRQRLLHLRQRQPVGHQFPRVHLHLILSRRPAKWIHIHNVRH